MPCASGSAPVTCHRTPKVSVERTRGKALSRFKIFEEGDVEEPTSDARYGDRVK